MKSCLLPPRSSCTCQTGRGDPCSLRQAITNANNHTGADTVGGNVDTSGYLTETVLGCVLDDVYLPLALKQTP